VLQCISTDRDVGLHVYMNRVIRTKSGHRPDVHWSRAAGRGRIMWIVDPADQRWDTDSVQPVGDRPAGRE